MSTVHSQVPCLKKDGEKVLVGVYAFVHVGVSYDIQTCEDLGTGGTMCIRT